jgi:hypothetical protein
MAHSTVPEHTVGVAGTTMVTNDASETVGSQTPEDTIDKTIARPPPWRVPGVNLGITQLIILLFAFIFFVVGVLVAQANQPPDPYSDLFRSCVQRLPQSPSCEAFIVSLHEKTHTYLHYSILEALAEALKALAIAVTVTVGVASILEGRNRIKLNAELTQKAQQIANNVFDGIFGNAHSPALLETLKRQILNKSIVRQSLDMRYTLVAYEGKHRLAGQRFTMLKAHVSATFKNIATAAGSDVHLPLELSLPNPLLNELKKLVRIDSGIIQRQNRDDAPLSSTELAAVNLRLQERLKDDDALEGHVKFGMLDLAPGETGGFEINYVMMKEEEDSELLRSFHTTSALTLTVIDLTNRNLFLRAKAIHPGKLKLINGEDNVSVWSLSDIILPQQGVLIWWKKKLPAPTKATRKSAAKSAQGAANEAVAGNPGDS